MEITHLVWKLDDLAALQGFDQEIQALDRISQGIGEYRESVGKNPDPTYVVINKDEPYIDEVTEIMKRNGHWE